MGKVLTLGLSWHILLRQYLDNTDTITIIFLCGITALHCGVLLSLPFGVFCPYRGKRPINSSDSIIVVFYIVMPCMKSFFRSAENEIWNKAWNFSAVMFSVCKTKIGFIVVASPEHWVVIFHMYGPLTWRRSQCKVSAKIV